MFEFAIYRGNMVEILACSTDADGTDWCTVAYNDGSPEFDVKSRELFTQDEFEAEEALDRYMAGDPNA